MPMIEVDETEISNLRAQNAHLANYAKVVEALKAHPQARVKLQEAIKTVKPDTPIAEYDARTAANEVIKQLGDQVAGVKKIVEDFKTDRDKDRLEADVTARVDSGRAMLRKRGYDADGITAVEKLMTEEGIASYEAADALFARRNPPQEMSIPGIQKNWALFEPTPDAKEEMKLLMSGGKDRVGDAYVRTQVPKILAEIRGQAMAA